MRTAENTLRCVHFRASLRVLATHDVDLFDLSFRWPSDLESSLLSFYIFVLTGAPFKARTPVSFITQMWQMWHT